MSQADGFRDSLSRLDASIESLEQGIAAILEERGAEEELRRQLRALTEERNRLIAECERLTGELEAERSRSTRIEAASDEVAERLELVTVKLRDLMASEGVEP